MAAQVICLHCVFFLFFFWVVRGSEGSQQAEAAPRICFGRGNADKIWEGTPPSPVLCGFLTRLMVEADSKSQRRSSGVIFAGFDFPFVFLQFPEKKAFGTARTICVKEQIIGKKGPCCSFFFLVLNAGSISRFRNRLSHWQGL